MFGIDSLQPTLIPMSTPPSMSSSYSSVSPHQGQQDNNSINRGMSGMGGQPAPLRGISPHPMPMPMMDVFSGLGSGQGNQQQQQNQQNQQGRQMQQGQQRRPYWFSNQNNCNFFFFLIWQFSINDNNVTYRNTVRRPSNSLSHQANASILQHRSENYILCFAIYLFSLRTAYMPSGLLHLTSTNNTASRKFAVFLNTG